MEVSSSTQDHQCTISDQLCVAQLGRAIPWERHWLCPCAYRKQPAISAECSETRAKKNADDGEFFCFITQEFRGARGFWEL